MRRVDREITSRDKIREILEKTFVMRIGFFDALYPYIIPLNFAFVIAPDNYFRFYFHSATEGRKLTLLKANNKVAFEADIFHQFIGAEAENPCRMSTSYESVTGYGRMKIVNTDDERNYGMEQLVNRFSTAAQRKALNAETFARTLVLRLDVESITGKRHVVNE